MSRETCGAAKGTVRWNNQWKSFGAPTIIVHYSTKLNEHFDIMIFIERYPLKRCQGCVKLIAVSCFLNINDLSEVQLCMSSNSWTWECPHTEDGADHVPSIFLSSVYVKEAQWGYRATKRGVPEMMPSHVQLNLQYVAVYRHEGTDSRDSFRHTNFIIIIFFDIMLKQSFTL